MFYKIIGSISSVGETIFAAWQHGFFVDMHGFDHAVEQSQAAFDCINRHRRSVLCLLAYLCYKQEEGLSWL